MQGTVFTVAHTHWFLMKIAKWIERVPTACLVVFLSLVL
jgi:hypothetical protein